MLWRTLLREFVKTRLVRHSSTLKTFFDETGQSGLVLKSTSTDIFENLALEDWIHDRVDLQNRSVLFLWRNTPAVVVGRHQNPWHECNLPLVRRRGIPLARRRSGGGTVFHDLGNVNITFFTSKKKYDRRRNLGVVTGALTDLSPGLNVSATERFDIVLDGGYKVSGTAAKLGRTSAYHHCTLLCCADRTLLSSVLKSPYQGIKSNATPSVPSPVKNLLDEDPRLDPSAVMEAVAARYNVEFGFDGPLVTVDPSVEALMPGVNKMAADLKSWEWVYGKTPKFSITLPFVAEGAEIVLDMDVKDGTIEKCLLDIPHDWLPAGTVDELCSALAGVRFCPKEVAVAVTAFMRTTLQGPDLTRKTHSLYENVVSVM
ncbi:lipoyltransferase 1, mitochondrial [Electrophorus electricus]|uniref:Lipoyl amidotransferase LIPT1, mitochondrial n=1 Tax=Electrophorus electricus TaxID=8005 RepID=A0A4W4GU82_ELEEL|nr:lipoyltransferase 1, mitochondrial [Electrophorus electricus]